MQIKSTNSFGFSFSHRWVASLFLILTSITLPTFFGEVYAEQPGSDQRKPNIILIMADDVSWEAFGSYGAIDYQTPNLDQLAQKGIRFSHCYSTPICTTSRVKIMTGKYNFRNYTHFGYLNPSEKTFGNLLQGAGYKTAIAGKWQLNGLSNSLPGFDSKDRPHDAGFEEYMLWQLTQPKSKGERFWSPLLEHNGKVLTKQMNLEKYGPDLMCDFVCDFIERNQNEPFFVYYPMALVHDPFVPTPDTIGDQPKTHAANKAPKGKEAKKKNFVAMVNYMDKLVGRIVAKVKDVDQMENTIILFTADNGTNRTITSKWNGQDIMGGKGGMTDMGTHVPLIAYWQGHTPEGVVLDDMIDFTDFYPTFAAAASLELGDEDPIDGYSFYARLTGQPFTPRPWVFCHYEPYWNKQPGQFVRNQQFKLYRDGRLFSVPNDLREEQDLAKSTETSIRQAKASLMEIMNAAPPASKPEKPGKLNGRTTKNRPVYPDWKSMSSSR
ncbi:MAG: sulfatase-like hydrolase/transferase [Planctomycetota bacterium]